MCFRPKSASVSSRRRRQLALRRPPSRALAVLNLACEAERQAHDFVQRMSSGTDASWQLLTLCRNESELLCVVRWLHPEMDEKPFSLARVSLVERAVCWRYYASERTARAALNRRCTSESLIPKAVLVEDSSRATG